MREQVARPAVTREELTRDVVILVVLHLASLFLVWQGSGRRGWELRDEPLLLLATTGAGVTSGLLTILALWSSRHRLGLALLAAGLAVAGLVVLGVAPSLRPLWATAREGWFAAVLAQLWLGGLAFAAALGTGGRGQPSGREGCRIVSEAPQ